MKLFVQHTNLIHVRFSVVITLGVLEANFVEPTNNKQDFERTSLFQKLETRLKEMQWEYWWASDNLRITGFTLGINCWNPLFKFGPALYLLPSLTLLAAIQYFGSGSLKTLLWGH